MMEAGSWTQIAATIATLMAVGAALFKEKIIGWLYPPKLIVSAKMSPPDIDKIPDVRMFMSGGISITAPSPISMSSIDTYFLRLWVQNVGRSKAENVQVFAAKLERKIAGDSFEPVDSFLPMNLRWAFGSETPTHAETFAEAILPEMGVHCNLARIAVPAHRKKLGDDHPEAKEGQTVMVLQTELRPTNHINVLKPGTYRLELLVAGNNCKRKSWIVELVLTGEWFDDKERMFREGVRMRVLDESPQQETLSKAVQRAIEKAVLR